MPVDDPQDTGIAGVDLYKMDAGGKEIEHWDTLQFVGEPKNSAPILGPNIPRQFEWDVRGKDAVRVLKFSIS
jgi:hypothetical protein